jgi:type II secretory pathway pseudopilin PulG
MKKVMNAVIMLFVSMLLVTGYSFAENNQHSQDKKQDKSISNQTVMQDSTNYGNQNGGTYDTTNNGYNSGRSTRTDTSGTYNNGNYNHNNGMNNNGNNSGMNNNGNNNGMNRTDSSRTY